MKKASVKGYLCHIALLLAVAGPSISSNLGAQATKNVIFGESAGQTQWTADSGAAIVRVYLDRNGDFYPIGQPALSDGDIRRSNGEVSLRAFFTDPSTGGKEWAAVFARSGARPDESKAVEWERWQDTIRGTHAARLNALLESTPGRRTLVVLVHGFNVGATAHEGAFAATRRQIQKSPAAPREPVFLQVAWDGATSTHKLPIRAWGNAQYNAPLVGLELRRLLAAVDSEVPVRVITHSLGALVAGTALWNSSGVFTYRALQADSIYRAYAARTVGRDTARYAFPKHKDIRIAMVAPATSAQLFERYMDAFPNAANVGRVVVGINEKDFVTTKGGVFANVMGATTLGATRKEFCERLIMRHEASLGPKSYLVHLYEPDQNTSRNRDHSWVTYAGRREYPTFLAKVFDADAGVPERCST